MHPYGLSANVMLCGSSDFKAAPALPLDQAAKSVPNTLLPHLGQAARLPPALPLHQAAKISAKPLLPKR